MTLKMTESFRPEADTLVLGLAMPVIQTHRLQNVQLVYRFPFVFSITF